MTTLLGDVVKVGDQVINIDHGYEYTVTSIHHGTAWMKRAGSGCLIRFNEDRHMRKV